jgi:hypothetical protein
MGPTYLVTLLVAAIVGGFVGWTYGTKNLYRRPGSKWLTDEIPKERINRRLLRRRRRERLQYALTAAAVAPVVLYVSVTAINVLVDMMRAAH